MTGRLWARVRKPKPKVEKPTAPVAPLLPEGL
jgi:hypothetical protein